MIEDYLKVMIKHVWASAKFFAKIAYWAMGGFSRGRGGAQAVRWSGQTVFV